MRRSQSLPEGAANEKDAFITYALDVASLYWRMFELANAIVLAVARTIWIAAPKPFWNMFVCHDFTIPA